MQGEQQEYDFGGSGFSFDAGMPFMAAYINQHYHQDQPDVLVNGVWMTNPNGAPLDATVHTRVISTCTASFHFGFSFPVAKLTESSNLTIEALLGMEAYHWNVGTVNYSENTSVFDSAYTQNFNLPLSLNYVFGGQADGHSRFTGAVGAGGALSYTHSKYINTEDRFSCRPFVMAELGLVAGFPIKLRATAYLGSINLIDKPIGNLSNAMEADGNISGNAAVKMTGSGGINLSLVVMPGYRGKW